MDCFVAPLLAMAGRGAMTKAGRLDSRKAPRYQPPSAVTGVGA